jgi:hypothetical protein
LNAYLDARVLLEALVEQPASAAAYADMLSQSGFLVSDFDAAESPQQASPPCDPM